MEEKIRVINNYYKSPCFKMFIKKKVKKFFRKLKLEKELTRRVAFKKEFEDFQWRSANFGIASIEITDLSYNETLKRIKEIEEELTNL